MNNFDSEICLSNFPGCIHENTCTAKLAISVNILEVEQ